MLLLLLCSALLALVTPKEVIFGSSAILLSLFTSPLLSLFF